MSAALWRDLSQPQPYSARILLAAGFFEPLANDFAVAKRESPGIPLVDLRTNVVDDAVIPSVSMISRPHAV
jgi:hypothetical protein